LTHAGSAPNAGRTDYTVRSQFDIDAMHAVECARVGRAYGERPDIYRRLSWNASLLGEFV